MGRRLTKRVRLWAASTSLLTLLGGAAAGQEPLLRDALEVPATTRLPIWPPELLAFAQAAQPEAKESAPAPAPAPASPPENNAFGNEPAPTTGTGLASLAAPNMIGDLLGAGRSVSFFVNRSAGAGFINAVGSTNIVNPAVADNNSPVPLDRVYFRYNHFADALAVTGASSQPAVPIGAGAFQAFTTTRSYDSDQYTFGFEKTFFNRKASLEFRLPFSQTLSPDLDLSYGAVTSSRLTPSSVPGVPGSFYQTTATPQNTLGHSSSQFGNLTLIFKWLFLQRDWLYFSGGVAATVPTGPDTDVSVTDFLGPFVNQADTIRFRDFHVRNQTWALSPYLAALVTPTERFFLQGFIQYDAPLNSSAVTYTETLQQTPTAPTLTGGKGALIPPFTVNDHIREQSLLHLDYGTGYWLVRRPEARWLTGLAPAAELHYTTTLDNANIITLPGDATAHLSTTTHQFVTNPPPPAPQVGNLRNRVDLLDLTLGTTFEFAGRTRLATAIVLPLRGADNRTFDWEFQLQLNYYFGTPRRPQLPPPSF
jgi:hypothetical protein